MKNKSVPVRQLMDSAISDRVQKNRAKLVPAVQTIISCGQQNVALRGHRDDFKHFDTDENPGNFQVFLELRLKGDDKTRTEHFMNAPRNMTYRSKTTQNEIIQCCGEYIRDAIINEIKEAKFFSVLADEACDVSNKEQMPLVLRFIDTNGDIREDFIKFILCENGVSGEAIADSIITEIRELGLDMENCRGQGYDDAGNMAGSSSSYPFMFTAHLID